MLNNLPSLEHYPSHGRIPNLKENLKKNEDAKPNKTKLKGYVFLRKSKEKLENGNSDEEQPKVKSNDSSEIRKEDEGDDNRLTEENNKLIEQIMFDRKRQYS